MDRYLHLPETDSRRQMAESSAAEAEDKDTVKNEDRKKQRCWDRKDRQSWGDAPITTMDAALEYHHRLHPLQKNTNQRLPFKIDVWWSSKLRMIARGNQESVIDNPDLVN